MDAKKAIEKELKQYEEDGCTFVTMSGFEYPYDTIPALKAMGFKVLESADFAGKHISPNRNTYVLVPKANSPLWTK